MFSLVFAAALLITSPEPAQQVNAPAAAQQVMAVPAELRDALRAQVSNTQREERRLELLVDYLFAPPPAGLGMRYEHDATYTVAEAFQTRTANCLSFTLLTVALAREVGLEAYGQDIAETLIWRQEENTIYRTTHVNAGIRIRSRRFTVDVASDQVLSRNPPVRATDARLLAQYFNNRSAELMAIGQLDLAHAYAQRSIELDATYPASWNNSGVLHLRAGRLEQAAQHYRQALKLDPENASALTNLASYYQRMGDSKQMQLLQKQLEDIQEDNPFHQFILATQFEQEGKLRLAAKHYKRAIFLHQGEHRFHFGLARTYFRMGKPLTAGRELERARQLSTGATRSIYQAKIDSLAQRKS